MRRLFGLLALSLAVAATAQIQSGGSAPKFVPKAGLQAQKDLRPVTVYEATQAFSKAKAIMSHGFGVAFPSNPVLANGNNGVNQPVTREQVVSALFHFLQVLQADMKFTPQPVSFDPSVLKIARSRSKQLQTLIRLGCVAKVGPVATGPKDTLTVHEFGDALGFFLARMALLTNMPNPKWTPVLGAGSS